ncbi:MAG TPA: hypothetical protein VFO89_05455, partial [Thermoanaerobaculia bacterium]|nr:hypothetical protein [Thermoanaerobaculia bacterium]
MSETAKETGAAEARPKILFVADGNLLYDEGEFSLLQCARILESRYDVTRAHLGNKYRFTDEGLRGFEQIWLFGHANQQEIKGRELETSELAAIAKFMNAGGGLFATGDHEDLGSLLCGSIPRVRSMRRWARNDTPSRGGSNRHDTLRSTTGRYFHELQADKLPQEIVPRRFASSGGLALVHPIFRLPNGTIQILPDHTHEGNCVKPATLTAKYDFGTVKGDEYPALDGVRVGPEILADEMVIGGHPTTEGGEVFAVTESGVFGAACAWDGHRVKVGRVVTAATWHHFMNVNIMNLLTVPAYKQAIEAYYRNIALWLDPPPRQMARIAEGFEAALRRYPLAEVPPAGDPSDARRALAIGVTTRLLLEALEPHITATLLAGLPAYDPFGARVAET